jgi:hypothetical protein
MQEKFVIYFFLPFPAYHFLEERKYRFLGEDEEIKQNLRIVKT